MIEKLSPTLELALQNELRQAYLKGVETGRKMTGMHAPFDDVIDEFQREYMDVWGKGVEPVKHVTDWLREQLIKAACSSNTSRSGF